MGGNSSKEEDLEIRQLNQRSQQHIAHNSVYRTTNSELISSIQDPFTNKIFSTSKPTVQSQVQKTRECKTEFRIVEGSVRLLATETPHELTISFNYEALSEMFLSIHCSTTELRENGKLVGMKVPEKSQTDSVFKVGPLPTVGPQEFPQKAWVMDTRLIELNKLTRVSGSIPLVITARRCEPSGDTIYGYYEYFVIQMSREMRCESFRKGVEMANGEFMVLDHVYGMAYKEDDKECAICLSNSKDTIIEPCRHMCLCFECANEFKNRSQKCPVCRGPIEKFIKIDKGETTS